MLKKFFISLLIFSFIAGQLIRLDIFGNFVPLLDISVALLIAYHVLTKRFSWKRYFEQKWLLLFIGTLIASNAINLGKYTLHENVTGNFYLVRFILYSLLIGVNFKISVPKIKITGLIIAVIGILQFIFLPDLRFLQYQNWDDHLNRLTFPYLDPAFTGIILLLFLIINLSDIVKKSRATKLMITLELMAIFLTFSRATWITTAIILALILLKKRISWSRKIVLPLGLISMLAVIYLSISNPQSYGNQLLRRETISSRRVGLEKAFKIWQKKPLFGIGFNNYRTYQLKNDFYVKNGLENRGETSVENSFVFVLVTGGILGFAAFIIWIYQVVKNLNGGNGLKGKILGAVLIASLFNNVFFYPFVLLMVFLIIEDNLTENIIC